METQQRLAARLDNIRATEPLLSALRNISLGNRLMALNRKRELDKYLGSLLHILNLVSPSLGVAPRRRQDQRQGGGEIALLVIGSERGLCGAFNQTVVAYAQRVLKERSASGVRARLMVLGARALRAFKRRGVSLAWSSSLSMTGLPRFGLCHELASQWLESYEDRDLDAVDIVYNAYRGMARFEPSIYRLLPPHLALPAEDEPEWPPIIETDPLGLYARTLGLWLSTTLYGFLLESATAEHSLRYRLLDGASQNAQRLIEEMSLSLQMARQEAITSEMQELAIGSGLYGSSPGTAFGTAG